MKKYFFGFCLSIALTVAARSEVTVNRFDALDFPSRHAWNLFLVLNHPAKNPSTQRGVPDLDKPVGAPGSTVLWETFRLSATEVFLTKGAKPPEDFNDESLPGSPVYGKVPELPKAAILKQLAASRSAMIGSADATSTPFDPAGGVFTGTGGFGESRMNKATYDFIVKNGLYSLEGQQRYFRGMLEGKHGPVSFPVDSIEVKAAWIKFTAGDLTVGKDKKYYGAEYKGDKFGLVSLHIITKDLPNWFWCTFHHVDDPNTGDNPIASANAGVETPDTFGRPHELDGTIWENYVLGGTQTDFITPTGRPTMLSDAYVEAGFEQSSCISCHARASVPLSGRGGLSSNPTLGIPYFYDFENQSDIQLMQLDFLFSLAFRAKSEKP